jgi:hypothetical protein
MKKNGVRCLLMGGQACVFYGAAEFSRDVDLAVLCNAENLEAFRRALTELEAERIAVPPFEKQYLDQGHAVHFRCQAAGVERLRIDILAKLRGVAEFAELWDRRMVIQIDDLKIDLMSLPDLVRAKRTQRDKDWPMTSRLITAHYFQHKKNASSGMIQFWLREMHDADLLQEVVSAFPQDAEDLANERPALRHLIDGRRQEASDALRREIESEKAADRDYWAPLKAELNELRKQRNH